MKLWRISNYADLTGLGGLRYSGRWHSKGRPIIYTADHPAGALVESLVHFDLDNIPERYQLITIDIDDGASIAVIEPNKLPPNWVAGAGISRSVGDAWLAAATSLLLRVPSAIIPDAWNVLINPGHPEATRMRIAKTEKVPLDGRLARR